MDTSDEEFDLDDDVDLNTMAAAYEFTMGRLWRYQDHPGVQSRDDRRTAAAAPDHRIQLRNGRLYVTAGRVMRPRDGDADVYIYRWSVGAAVGDGAKDSEAGLPGRVVGGPGRDAGLLLRGQAAWSDRPGVGGVDRGGG
jgi:hypothetical protein